ncbi:MAG: DUF5678 domain-containing protein [bacterium]|nr:DUF5678 domain-containing protein [bacterium]
MDRHTKKYAGQWVALKDDEETVVGHGATLQEAIDMAKACGYDDPIVTVMPREIITFIGGYGVSL